MGLQVVWFKRDLRTHDHAPLVEACARGAVLPLYVVEPELWRQPDAAGRQYALVRESLIELRQALATLGQPLIVLTGDVLEILCAIHAEHGVAALWSHQETGNGWTFDRDRAVAAWCRAEGIPWHEPRPFGVIRGLRDRTGWAGRWNRFMRQPLLAPPTALQPLDGLDPEPIPSGRDLGLAPDPCPRCTAGGRHAGLAELASFLTERGEPYQKAMSSPNTAFDACSRLSVHLAHGTLSMREIFQAARRRQADVLDLSRDQRGSWPGALRSFLARLHWHCHFMQKLEDEPRIEFESFHPAYDGLRVGDAERLKRWSEGRTGLPFVDACMRALAQHGWINFRMRAMLVSFASYQLWLPWRATGLHLARLFTDYEPGIHWPQMQMQSATTGINLPRIYNPTKQGRDFDPDGVFIRKWVPELADVPAAFVHEPWTWDGAACRLAGRYPTPIVDERSTRRAAQERIWAVRRQPRYHEIADAIQVKHGSRKSGITQQSGPIAAARQRARAGATRQLQLELSD